METNEYTDLVKFLSSGSDNRIWPDWIASTTGEKKRRLKKNFYKRALGSSQRAGFALHNNLLYKRFFKDKAAREFAQDRMVVQKKDLIDTLKKIHDEAGHTGIGNTRRNCRKEDSLMIW